MPLTPRVLQLEGLAAELSPGITWLQVVPLEGLLADTWRETSDTLSNAADRALLVAARRACDLVVTTARTATVEGYRASKVATIVVVDRGGEYVPPASGPDTKPVIDVRDISEVSKLGIASDFILLESGMTYAAALGNRIENLLITVADCSDPSAAISRVTELARLLGGYTLDGVRAVPLQQNTLVMARITAA